MTTGLKPQAEGVLGRGRVLRHLLSLVRSAVGSGQATSVLLTGAPGVGKSTVATAMVQGLVEQLGDVAVVALSGDPLAQHRSWSGLRRARCPGGLPVLETALSTFSPDTSQTPTEDFLGPLISETCRGANEAMMRPLIAAFDELTRQHVVVVTVEDAHYMDVATLDALSGLMQRFSDRPFVVLLVGWEHVVETTSHLFSNPQMIFEELGGLDPISIGRLVGTWLGELGSLLDDGTKDLLASHARGNPLFARELVTGVVKKYEQYGVEGFDPGAFALPLTIDDLYRMRIEKLDSQARDLLNRCAVGGFQFGRATACAGNGNAVADAMDALVQDGTVASNDAASATGECFSSGGLYEVAQGMCSAFRETTLHGDTSRWLLENEGYSAREVAYHLVRSDRPAESRSHWMDAACLAIGCGDFRMAISMLGTAAALTLDPSRKSSLIMSQLNLHASQGDWNDVVRLLGSIPERVIDDEDALASDHTYWRSEAYEAGYGATQGGDLAVDLLQQSMERAVAAGDSVRQVRALSALAIVLAKNDAQGARDTWSQALTLAKDQNVSLSIFPYVDLCVRQASEDQEGVRVAAKALLDPEESTVNAAVAIRVTQLLTDMEIAEEQWDAAAFLLEELVARSRLEGDRVREVEALLQWSWVCDQMNATNTATPLVERALALALRLGNAALIERCRARRTERGSGKGKGESQPR